MRKDPILKLYYIFAAVFVIFVIYMVYLNAQIGVVIFVNAISVICTILFVYYAVFLINASFIVRSLTFKSSGRELEILFNSLRFVPPSILKNRYIIPINNIKKIELDLEKWGYVITFFYHTQHVTQKTLKSTNSFEFIQWEKENPYVKFNKLAITMGSFIDSFTEVINDIITENTLVRIVIRVPKRMASRFPESLKKYLKPY